MVDQFDNHLSDSGFKSNCYPDKRKSSEKSSSPKIEIPQMMSFVGGAFTVQLYKSAVCSIFAIRFCISMYRAHSECKCTFLNTGNNGINNNSNATSDVNRSDATKFILCSRCG